MNKNEIKNFLKEVSLFKNLDEHELELIVEKVNIKELKKGKFIFKENSLRDAIYIVYSGEIELFKVTPFGEEKRLSFFRQYDFIEESSLIDDHPHSTSARALYDVKLFVLRSDEIQEVFNEYPQITLKLYKHLAGVITRRMTQTNIHFVYAISR